MTLAQYLFALLLVLVAIDLWTTLVGLRQGLSETNQLAVVAMMKLGHWQGLIAYELVWLGIYFGLIVLWPDQWGAVAIGIAASGAAVSNNLLALNASKDGN